MCIMESMKYMFDNITKPPTEIQPDDINEQDIAKHCKQWECAKDAIDGTIWAKLYRMKSEIVPNRTSDLHGIISMKERMVNATERAMWNLTKYSAYDRWNDVMLRTIEDSSISERVWINLFEPIQNIMHENIWKRVNDAMYVHVLAQFTKEQMNTFVDPKTDEQKLDTLTAHTQFKDLDWFWNNGLYYFQGIMKGENFVCSFNDPRYYRRVTFSKDDVEIEE